MRNAKQLPFIELYLKGKVLPEKIDDYVDQWHANPGGQEIYEFLGMSREEYGLWLRDPKVLPQIAQARKEHRHLAKFKARA
jgi:hypothetical protein